MQAGLRTFERYGFRRFLLPVASQSLEDQRTMTRFVLDYRCGAVRLGEPGEIWVRGPIVMRGYLDNPQATAETIDQDGWLHTGDIGYCDADGDFWLVDRVKELIKYKGLQVAPAQLEAVLLLHPAVADAAVYPQLDAEAGEIPKAAAVLKPGQSITAEALMTFVAAQVAPQKRVRALRFVDQIPKSASGKILRRVLIAQDAQALK